MSKNLPKKEEKKEKLTLEEVKKIYDQGWVPGEIIHTPWLVDHKTHAKRGKRVRVE